MPANNVRDAYVNKSLQRALAILDCFSADDTHLTLRELSDRLGIHRASVYRLAANLVAAGYLTYDDETGRYSLGLRLLELGALVLSEMDLPKRARPHLDELRDRTNETAQLGIVDDLDVIYVAQSESPQRVKLSGFYGSRWPLYATALGRVLLAGLPEPEAERRILASAPLKRRTDHTIVDPQELLAKVAEVRRDGFAFDDQETETGLRCLAAPVHDHRGQVVAAVGISGPSYRIAEGSLEALVEAVKGTASAVSHEVGYKNSATRAGGRQQG